MGFVRSFPPSVFLPFFQFYVKHDLRKNKIVVPFFSNRLIFMNYYLGFSTLKFVFGFKIKTLG